MKGKKGDTDEGGIRSVCYIAWPSQLPRGHSVAPIAGAIDLLPTLTSLAGLKRVGDKPLDGRDLSPLLKNEAVDWPDRMLFTTWAGKSSVRTQQYRLDHAGKLFDMQADPGQSSPINDRAAAEARRLQEAVVAWRKEMFGDDVAPRVAKGVDPRPIPVGYREFPITMLPARDGEPHGGIQRSSAAPNCSYFVNWKTPEDHIVWLVQLQTTGKYEVTIDYTCPENNAGSLLELSFQSSKLTGKVTPAWDPPLYNNQDTLPRPHGESQMKEFHTLSLGQVELPAGQGPLTLRALKIPGKSVMDLRRITLTLLP